jgi:hypothetical protein
MGTTVFTANMKNQAIKELVDTKVFQQSVTNVPQTNNTSTSGMNEE